MVAKSELVEYRDGIGCENVLGRTTGIEGEQNGDQAADDMRVAVAEIFQDRAACVALELLRQPDLADASLHLVPGRMLGLRHRLQRAAEFDDVPIAVVPLFQQL